MASGMGWCTGCFVLPYAMQRILKVFDPWSLMTLCFFENLLFKVHHKISSVDIGCAYGTRLQELFFLCFPDLGTQTGHALFPCGTGHGHASTPFSQMRILREGNVTG